MEGKSLQRHVISRNFALVWAFSIFTVCFPSTFGFCLFFFSVSTNSLSLSVCICCEHFRYMCNCIYVGLCHLIFFLTEYTYPMFYTIAYWKCHLQSNSFFLIKKSTSVSFQTLWLFLFRVIVCQLQSAIF